MGDDDTLWGMLHSVVGMIGKDAGAGAGAGEGGDRALTTLLRSSRMAGEEELLVLSSFLPTPTEGTSAMLFMDSLLDFF